MQDTAEPIPTGSLLRRLHKTYGAMPDSERRVADAILTAPSEMAVWTASELAGHAGVSKATVSRIIQRLGYRNFESARQDARKLRETGSPLFMSDAADLSRDGKPNTALIRTEAEIIDTTLSQVDMTAVRDAAQTLASAGQVRTLGFRNSRFLADYFNAQIAQLRPNVAPMVQDGQTVAEGITSLGRGDVAVVVGLRRRPSGFSQMVQLIAEQDARLLLLADHSLRGAPAFATWTMTCVVETGSTKDSYGGALALLRLLAIECGTALGDNGRQHLKKVEALREDLDELDL